MASCKESWVPLSTHLADLSLSSLPSPFGVITGLELHWMGDGPAGTKEAENNAIWWFSRRTVLMTVPDSGATRVTVPSECMTSRPTRRNAQGELVTFTNKELARLERTNRQQPRQTDTTMGDHANQDELAAAMALMQQQMQQMQQTIQAQQDAAEQAALAQQEQQAQTNQNKRQPQSNQQAVPANENSQPDELQGLGMMMQQLLQGQQVQAKVLNQVTTEIDTRMGNMFTELNNKYDNLAIHMRKIDVQLAQTAESVKRQQETLPGRTDKNPRTEHCNAIEQPFAETASGAEERADEPAETPPSRVYVPKVPYPIPPRHLMDPISEEQLIGFNKMVRRLPKELAFEDALQIRPLLKFFKNCRETQEEIKVLYTKALSTPALKVLPKVDDPGKFVFPCSIAGTTFKDALCDSEKLKVVPEKEHGDKGLELHWMGDGPAGTKEAENNAIWWFSRRTVLMTVPDSGATRVTVPTACGFEISPFSIFPDHSTLF
ncbi:hypothetical protein IGI04_006853 [Brassica rapa subsp. trilocularis]|uniref:Retrotransposon gag domain-containing protein n=1 Tax=Brassica rapa subsp. trilocularis TaxID=1813537 RepID=A0ABQ7NL88_BRACM|nr:hypothetical protein IGI04_006853 [Brassica rapa subsp. trilocularis]